MIIWPAGSCNTWAININKIVMKYYGFFFKEIEGVEHPMILDHQEALHQDMVHQDSVAGVMAQGDLLSEVHHHLTLEDLVVPDSVDHHHLILTGDQCHLQECIHIHT
jgi:hypothetical protein